MLKSTLLFIVFFTNTLALQIIQKPILFNNERVKLTKEYIQQHYNLKASDITIIPKVIVIHHTGINSLEASFNKMYETTLSKDRAYISKSGLLNVSAHYMIDKDGTIYQLMPDNYVARHVIGLNYSSIGIENVGGENFEDNLTKEQMQANIALISYLSTKYKELKYMIAHYEYEQFVNHALWLEMDKNYRTKKYDPSPRFIEVLRKELKKTKIELKSRP